MAVGLSAERALRGRPNSFRAHQLISLLILSAQVQLFVVKRVTFYNQSCAICRIGQRPTDTKQPTRNMGTTPSHEVDVAEDEPDDSEDEDILKMQNGRFRVSSNFFLFYDSL